jgi:tellurite resistance-related uncharacterized protein
MAMPELPSDVVRYSTVPAAKQGQDYFTSTTIPKGLLNDHSTKSGTWGIIRVNQGLLEYTIQDDPSAPESFALSPDTLGVIEPDRKHHVKALSENVEFVVEFYRFADTGPVDEQREGL